MIRRLISPVCNVDVYLFKTCNCLWLIPRLQSNKDTKNTTRFLEFEPFAFYSQSTQSLKPFIRKKWTMNTTW